MQQNSKSVLKQKESTCSWQPFSWRPFNSNRPCFICEFLSTRAQSSLFSVEDGRDALLKNLEKKERSRNELILVANGHLGFIVYETTIYKVLKSKARPSDRLKAKAVLISLAFTGRYYHWIIMFKGGWRLILSNEDISDKEVNSVQVLFASLFKLKVCLYNWTHLDMHKGIRIKFFLLFFGLQESGVFRSGQSRLFNALTLLHQESGHRADNIPIQRGSSNSSITH